MKKISNGNGTEVSDRSYYFLLDWNEDDNWKYMQQEFGKMKLSELTTGQYRQLFKYASEYELNNM